MSKTPKAVLEKIQKAIDTKATKLEIKNNEMDEFPMEIFHPVLIENLKTLRVSGDGSRSKIKTIPTKIEQFKNLSSLSLSLNQLTSLPESVGQLTNLSTLYLSSNKFRNSCNNVKS